MTRKILFVLIALALLVGIAAADSLVIPDTNPAVYQQKTIDVRLSATNGLSGYNITFAMENATVAQIYSVSFPSWATLSSSTGDPGSVVITVAADLGNQVTAPTVNEEIVSLTIKGLAEGTTTLYATANQIDNDVGGLVSPSITNGTITVLLSTGPIRPKATATIEPFNTTAYDTLTGLWGGTTISSDVNASVTPDWEGFIPVGLSAWDDLGIGDAALVILAAIPFIIAAIRQERTIIPLTLALIFGAWILVRLPAEYYPVAVAITALCAVPPVYAFMKERM